MEKIEIDFDVWKELTSRRKNEKDSYNDLLRRVLNLPTMTKQYEDNSNSVNHWITQGVIIPEGTEFRSLYKKKYYYGKVEMGELVVDNIRFNSPSKGARYITKNSVNGWIFWECKLPGKNSFQKMSSLRR